VISKSEVSGAFWLWFCLLTKPEVDQKPVCRYRKLNRRRGKSNQMYDPTPIEKMPGSVQIWSLQLRNEFLASAAASMNRCDPR